ncbi:serine hydrolase [Caulobacter segnis]|uniref:beta-lactamase n=2 Tax=Caulobacter segnis TaxID=88688 RepID=D5VFF5_CAUST|nr:serine hydrolase [Caulobacter segnis]ADG09687.1 beta-lactamase [Caulobacter segnis ATCC 21756]AVQ01465.1 serine hydrolase [Caulobacter segnis]
MSRRAFLTALAALPLLAACGQKPMLGQEEPAMDPKGLQKAILPIAARAEPAVLGVAAEDLGTRQIWGFNGDRAFVLGGAARVPVLAAVMAERAAGRLDLNEQIDARDVDLSPPPSAVADAWPGRESYTVAELEALARTGDNTALDLLTKRIGGPGAVNGWLDVRQLRGVSVDRYRRQVETDTMGMASFRADWRGETAWRRALASVSADKRATAARQRAADPRDTTTPVGVVRLLETFNTREAFASADPRLLLGNDPGYLASALPEGAKIWQAAGSARPDLGVVAESHAVALIELKDGRRIALAVFLTRSTTDVAAREAIITEAGRTVLKSF